MQAELTQEFWHGLMVFLFVEADLQEDVTHELALGNQRLLSPSLVLGIHVLPTIPTWVLFLPRIQPESKVLLKTS